ncbi:hypothetical protein BB560_006487, partial [Smittium megazygosporum]
TVLNSKVTWIFDTTMEAIPKIKKIFPSASMIITAKVPKELQSRNQKYDYKVLMAKSFSYSFIFTFFLLTSPLFLINSIFLIYTTLPCLITHYISFFYFPLLVTCYLPPSPLLPHPRVKKGSFAGAHVFPGGKLDDIDKSSAWLHYTDPSGIKDPLLSYKVCAIRETFEETGLLLAKNRGSATEPTNLQDIGDGSGVIMDGLYRKVKTENLELVTNKLKYVSRWITPEFAPRRFDAHFYMINLDNKDGELYENIKQKVEASISNNDGDSRDEKLMEDGDGELMYLEWRSPDEYLDMYCNGKIIMITPQIYSLMKLTRFPRHDDLKSYFSEWNKYNSVEPLISFNNSSHQFSDYGLVTLPGDSLYNQLVSGDFNGENHIDHFESGIGDLQDNSKMNLHRLVILEDQKTNKLSISLHDSIENTMGYPFESNSVRFRSNL